MQKHPRRTVFKRLPKRPHGAKKLHIGAARAYNLMGAASAPNAKKIGAGIGALAFLHRKGKINRHDMVRIMNAPMKDSTLAAVLRNFSLGRIGLPKLLETIERSYERQVPREVEQRLLNCPKGEFLKAAYEVARAYGSPKSFMTARALQRMRIAGAPVESVREFQRISGEIHDAVHEVNEAKASGNAERARHFRRMERILQRDLINRFVRRL
jgi:hypothetical protein